MGSLKDALTSAAVGASRRASAGGRTREASTFTAPLPSVLDVACPSHDSCLLVPLLHEESSSILVSTVSELAAHPAPAKVVAGWPDQVCASLLAGLSRVFPAKVSEDWGPYPPVDGGSPPPPGDALLASLQFVRPAALPAHVRWSLPTAAESPQAPPKDLPIPAIQHSDPEASPGEPTGPSDDPLAAGDASRTSKEHFLSRHRPPHFPNVADVTEGQVAIMMDIYQSHDSAVDWWRSTIQGTHAANEMALPTFKESLQWCQAIGVFLVEKKTVPDRCERLNSRVMVLAFRRLLALVSWFATHNYDLAPKIHLDMPPRAGHRIERLLVTTAKDQMAWGPFSKIQSKRPPIDGVEPGQAPPSVDAAEPHKQSVPQISGATGRSHFPPVKLPRLPPEA